MVVAGGFKRFLVPAAPPLLQPQPGKARHEVKFAGPGVPLSHRDGVATRQRLSCQLLNLLGAYIVPGAYRVACC